LHKLFFEILVVFTTFVNQRRNAMLIKDNVIKTISTFPDSFTLDELVDKLIFMDKVERGLEESMKNKIYTHEEARDRLGKWLK